MPVIKHAFGYLLTKARQSIAEGVGRAERRVQIGAVAVERLDQVLALFSGVSLRCHGGVCHGLACCIGRRCKGGELSCGASGSVADDRFVLGVVAARLRYRNGGAVVKFQRQASLDFLTVGIVQVGQRD